MTDAPPGPASGPLTGLKVLELTGIGPAPFAAMLLADLGADVLRIERPGAEGPGPLDSGTWNFLHRSRPTVAIDLKQDEGRGLVLRLIESADALIEGFRPGVMERLGLGPADMLATNRRLVYGRMTGFGQYGPLADAVGHDINYIALAGALGASTRAGERPMFPANLLGDFGGGGMLLAFGLLAALWHARTTGQGQVIDAAMVDGVALFTTALHALRKGGFWMNPPGHNLLDSGAPFYEVYETADAGHVAVGAIEAPFYEELLRRLEIDADDAPQWDQARWPGLKEVFADRFRRRTSAEWRERLEGSDACATVVLGLEDAPRHPHNQAREIFLSINGSLQPAPAPRFSVSRVPPPTPPTRAHELPEDGLQPWGIPPEEVRRLRAAGLIG